MGFQRLLYFFLILLVLSIFSYYYPEIIGKSVNLDSNYDSESVVLLRVIDGDTIELDNGEHIRMLGINNIEV